MTTPQRPPSEFVEAAIEAALRVGAMQLQMLPESHESKQVSFKRNPTDLVTRADRLSEEIIVGLLRKRFPDHGVLGEEGTLYEGKEYRWIIDPVDGTTNFTHGVPLFAVSIGLEYRGQLVAGVVFHPPMNELFYADRGRGAFLRASGTDQELAVSAIAAVDEAVVATGLPYDIRDTGSNVANINRLVRAAREVRILGAAALHLAYVAAGRIEAFWEPALNPWDLAAGALLVEEAGGRLSHMSGGPFRVDCRDLLATNGRVHEQMVGLLSSAAG
jgi:myo-inositol-1(or 4)-monophosphatase